MSTTVEPVQAVETTNSTTKPFKFSWSRNYPRPIPNNNTLPVHIQAFQWQFAPSGTGEEQRKFREHIRSTCTLVDQQASTEYMAFTYNSSVHRQSHSIRHYSLFNNIVVELVDGWNEGTNESEQSEYIQNVINNLGTLSWHEGMGNSGYKMINGTLLAHLYGYSVEGNTLTVGLTYRDHSTIWCVYSPYVSYGYKLTDCKPQIKSIQLNHDLYCVNEQFASDIVEAYNNREYYMTQLTEEPNTIHVHESKNVHINLVFNGIASGQFIQCDFSNVKRISYLANGYEVAAFDKEYILSHAKQNVLFVPLNAELPNTADYFVCYDSYQGLNNSRVDVLTVNIEFEEQTPYSGHIKFYNFSYNSYFTFVPSGNNDHHEDNTYYTRRFSY